MKIQRLEVNLERKLTLRRLTAFKGYLSEDEKSEATVEKYMRDTRVFYEYVGDLSISKGMVLSYKESLKERYAIASANSMLAALNKLFRFLGWHDLCVKQFKVQRQAFCPAQKELSRDEYKCIVKAAENKNNERLSLVIQTICSTGIRVSELSYITTEAVRRGQATVSLKGKTRTVFIVSALQKKLLRYAKEHRITSGAIFVTKTGKPLNRSNIWRENRSSLGVPLRMRKYHL